MSDILIKGMEMPKDIEPGLVIEFADGIDGKRYARLYHYRHGGLTEWLEAVPVPPHGGRLIDAYALDINRREERVLIDYEAAPFSEYLEGVKDGLHEAAKCVSTAPTIIPAEDDRA